jgi:AcrR family transcriptional regulator
MSKKTTIAKQKTGSSAQDRLLEAAVDVFGRHGFEAATTRLIAREAGVNIAAIPYYYSGKEGLYRAAVSYIVTKVEIQVAAVLAEIGNRSFTGAASREAALALLERLLEKIINFMVGSPQAPRVARIILREQLYPSSAYEIIFNGFLAPVLDSIATLVTVITGEPSSRTAKLRAWAVIGQIIAFRVGRETMVRALDLEGYSAKEMLEIRQIILEQTRGAMEALTRS